MSGQCASYRTCHGPSLIGIRTFQALKDATNLMTKIEKTSSSALHLLHRAGQIADELFTVNIGASDLTPRQYEVLRAISLANEPSQTQLVEMTGIDRSTLADIVRRLVDRGLVMRKRTRHDARMYALRLSDKGTATMREAGPAVSLTDDRLLSTLPQRDRESFVKSLEKMVEELSQAQEQPKVE